jgi:DNA-binding transcriptional regulator YiaG
MKNKPVKKGYRRIPLILTEEQIEALDEKVFAHASKKQEVSRAFFIGKWIDAGCPMPGEETIPQLVKRTQQQIAHPRKQNKAEQSETLEALQRQSDGENYQPPVVFDPATGKIHHILGEPATFSRDLKLSPLEAQSLQNLSSGPRIAPSVVRAWRRKNRLSLDELAIRLGCSERLVSAWENEEDFDIPGVIQEKMALLVSIKEGEPAPEPNVKEETDSTLQALPDATPSTGSRH